MSIFQIHLLDKCQKHTYHFVESNTKENALSLLTYQKELNLDNYSMILVVDLSKQILKDPFNRDSFNVVIEDDKLISYDKDKLKSYLFGKRLRRLLDNA